MAFFAFGAKAQDVIPSSVDIRLVQGPANDVLEIQLMPHSTAGFGGILSALTVTVRYDAASTQYLGNAVSFCQAWSNFPPSPVVIDNGMAYRTYNGFGLNRLEDPEDEGGCNTVLQPETWFTVASIPLFGEGCTEFILGDDAFTAAHNRSFYIAMDGWEVTGEVVEGSVTAGDCSQEDCLGVEDGPDMPGTPCDDGDPGTENDTWTVDCECVGTPPCVPATITSMSSNSPVCANGTLVLGATAIGDQPITFEWSGSGTFSPDDQSDQVSVTGAVSGTYTVTVTNACGSDSDGLAVEVDPPLSGSISYEGSPYCSHDGPMEVTFTGVAGGQFTAVPGGLSLDASTGTVIPSASQPGTYTVEYSVDGSDECPGYTVSTELTIVPAPEASIQYGTVCGTGSMPVVLTGATGGSFSSTPQGLVLNPATGEIDLGASTEGTYTVTYTIAASGACGEVSTSTTVGVFHPSSASIQYHGSPYCVNGGMVPVTQTGTTGGSYSVSPPGLAVDVNTGAIDLDASAVGVYQVTYTVPENGPCPAFSTSTTVLVSTSLLASISYNQGPYCASGGTAQVTRTGSSGGTYSASPAGLQIDGNTGTIDLGTSMPGSYTVTYGIPASGACGDFTTTTSFELLPPLSATILYGENPYCTNGGVATVTFTGDAGGFFTSSPAGLALDGNSGAIDLVASAAGSYVVTYNVGSSISCAFSTNAPVSIVGMPWAEISYDDGPYCTSGGIATVTQNGTMGGTYIASAEGLTLDEEDGSIVLQTSAPGTYTVTYTMPAVGPCPSATASTEVVVEEALTATIAYPGNPFCEGDGQGVVSISGHIGGTFSAEPAGLAIDPVSGTLDLEGSSPGSYTVTYSIGATAGCAAFTTTSEVFVQQASWAAISYEDAPYCTNGGSAEVVLTGTGDGTYAASPEGLDINATTGMINLNTSTPGGYTVTYTVPALGPCPAFTTGTELVVLPAPMAAISYPGSPFCAGGGLALVAFSGDPGGTYGASPSGLVIDAATGVIDLGGSMPGTYTVTYGIAASGSCDAFAATTEVVVEEGPWASIGYENGPYCTSGGSALVTRTGTAGGTYSADPEGLVLDASTGQIDLGSSTPGTYTVTYAVPPEGPCGAFSTSTEIVVQPAPTASILYEESPYCSNEGQATVSFSGTPGGTYTASPAGLGINATTGMINLYTSTPGSYTVTYTIPATGGCAAVSATTGVQVTAAAMGAIGYNDDPYCTGDGLATVLQVGTPGGTYSASPVGLVIDANTGAIDLAFSEGGNYTVTYTIPAGGGCPEFSNSTSFILFNVGDPCDDDDPVTVNDMIQEDCTCAGDIIDLVEGPTEAETGMLLYPNPNRTGRVTLHMEGLDTAIRVADIRMLDAVGRQVHRLAAGTAGGRIHEELVLPQGLVPGLYLMEVMVGDRHLVGRLMID